MMRNCFKRYDKANGNIDFSSVNASGANGPSGGNSNTKQSQNAQQPSAAVGMTSAQQTASNTQHTAASTNALVKTGGGPHHKSHKSTSLTAQQMSNAYILPQTTQSRTLQYQQQQKLNVQLKSQPSGGVNTGSNAGVGGHAINSKSTSNIHAAHHGAQSLGGLQHASGSATMAEKHTGMKLTRPESGKKRTSFLLHAQASSQPGTVGATGAGVSGQQTTYTATGATAGAGSSSLMNKLTGHHSNSMSQSVGATGLYNTDALGQFAHHHQSKGAASTTPSESGAQGVNGGGGFVTSPPKRGGQTRKPSGKSTKSNRAAIAKKQLITHSSHQIFPTAAQIGSSQHTAAGHHHAALTNHHGSSQHHHYHHHNAHGASGASQPTTSPILAKMTAATSGVNNAPSTNNRDSTSSAHHLEGQQQQLHHHHPLHGAHGGRDKLASASQPRQPTSSGNFMNAGGAQPQTSSYIINKNSLEYQRRGNSQQRGSQIKQSMTPSSGSGVGHYLASGNAGADSTNIMMHSKSSSGVASGVEAAASSAQYHSNHQAAASGNKPNPVTKPSPRSVEHGAVAAVAAVVPQSSSTDGAGGKQVAAGAGGAGSVASQGVGGTASTSGSAIAGGTNGTTASGARPAAQQKFLPTIMHPPVGGSSNNSATASTSSHQQSQAMYAATSISPYHSVEEIQQNIPHQPNSNQMLMNNSSSNDYFSLKQTATTSQTGSGGPASGAIRSTSQPNLHQSHANNSIVQGSASKASYQPGAGNNSVGVVAPHGAGIGGAGGVHTTQAHQQMQKILGSGLRSSSEPPQPKLKPSDSTGSFMENLRQRATFTVVMKAAMLPKQPKRTGERTGTEAQLASESVKATVTKLLQKNQPQSTLPFFQTSKVSAKAFGSVKAFAANTNVGTVRKANEDRISIILNVIQPQTKTPRVPTDQWPKLQIFGVYDGHGGSKCAEYLKDNLHNNVILQPEFPSDIPTAIKKGSWKTEEDFLKIAAPSPDQQHNKAGSCAIVILVVNDDIWILNVGDSRAICSESLHPSDSMIHATASQALQGSTEQMPTPQVQMEATSNVRQLSNDHKPSCPREFQRITDAGGYIYQTQTVMKNGLPTTATQQVRQETVPEPEDSDEEENPFVGPYRVFPGRLSVCRTFGDCEAKLAHLGGIQGVVSCEPEITHEVDGSNYIDYVLIGSDGIFDKMKNDTINEIIWDVTTKQRALAHSQGQVPSVHTISGLVADEILHAAAKARSLDNISVVFVAFQRFKEYIEMANQEYIQPAPPVQQQQAPPQYNINLQNEAEDFISQKVTPLRHEIMKTMKNNGGGLATNPSHKDRNTVPKSALIGHHHQLPNKNIPGSHKASFIGGNTPKSHGIEQPTAGSSSGHGGGHKQADGNSTAPGQSNYYLNKLRQQEQQQQQQQTSSIRHNGMLENINRPSSRQGASRKGMRSRKANTSGLATNAASHSQDSRPTLPQVQQSSHHQHHASHHHHHHHGSVVTNSSAKNHPGSASNGKNHQLLNSNQYNTLVDPVTQGGKGSHLTSSASASTLPKTTLQTNTSGNLVAATTNVNNSSISSSGGPAQTSQVVMSQSVAGAAGGQSQITSGGVNSRDGTQLSSAHQTNRRGGLFKVNTTTTTANAAQQHGSVAGAANHHHLPDFMTKHHHHHHHTKHNNNNQGNSISSSTHSSVNNSQMGSAAVGSGSTKNNADGGTNGRSSINNAGGNSTSAAGAAGAAAASSSNTGSSQMRKKMKPYKSNQIRRMPDNSSNLPLKFVTEQSTSSITPKAAAGGHSRDSSMNTKQQQQNATSHQDNSSNSYQHRF